VSAVLLLALLVSVALPVSAAPAKTATTKVAVKLYEFGIRRKPAFVAAGRVTFSAKNIGIEKHEMVVVRAQPGVPLPTAANGSVDEEAIPEADHIGEIENVKPKKTKSLTKKLAVGDYVFFCNLVDKEKDGTTVSHYAEGMYVRFSVG
jgi:uncharacterized cupredoxin-like copper-binding protein